MATAAVAALVTKYQRQQQDLLQKCNLNESEC